MKLSDVTIGVTSFLRKGFAQHACEDIFKNFAECPTIICDDSDYEMSLPWTCELKMRFDIGLSAKRNAIVHETMTKYLLMGSDDFLYDQKARKGVELMRGILERHPEVSVAAGRYNNNRYEGHIEYKPELGFLRENFLRPTETPYCENPDAYRVDLTANYFLARTEDIVEWQHSDIIKIGGEHILWFLDMKLQDKIILWVPGAEIDPQPRSQGNVDPRYRQYRKRAIDAHEWMKKYLGIIDYIDFNGVKS